MQWVRFEAEGVSQWGILRADVITAVSLTWDEILAGQLPDVSDSGPQYQRDAVRLLAPVGRPGKVIAIGKNYLDHCRETNTEPPARPLIFAKFPTAIIGPGDAIIWSAALTQQVDYEAELAVVIGKTARRVSEADALDYVFGYTVANDVSARDLQFGDGQWVRGKSLDTFCPLGPAVITADEIPDPQTLAIRCELNGIERQASTTSEMIFGVAQLVAFCSQAFTLEPGDMILTGTPHGVGAFRDPKLFMGDGDTVVVEIERVGRLENRCIVE
ncbi:MAG: fumarylacetoacetate hydrolase family protein [Anaerolineae bacterium]|nr:fumarylacetoacetate hydrolase family protein [Anaerolineae bacterium]